MKIPHSCGGTAPYGRNKKATNNVLSCVSTNCAKRICSRAALKRYINEKRYAANKAR